MKTNFIELVDDLARILRGGATYWRGHYRDYQTCPARDWHGREQRKYPMHPAVLKALESGHRPYDWHLLTLEWPHVSETDSTRLAYTRDDRAGEADRQVVTTLGKYLTRHFPDMPDHEIRNLVALYSAGESCKFVYTMAEMLHHIMRGPTSCMGGDKNFDVRCADGERRHPYQVYDPKYGWHMAVRVENDDTVGRALCMANGDDKYFVRSYRKTDGYSPADERLEAWLQAQGYSKQGYWEEDAKLAYYETGGGDILAPYIDGGHQCVDVCGNRLEIRSDGEYECTSTSGYAQETNGDSCNDCGDRIREGDGYWVGRHEDCHVCQSCCDSDYYYAYGRGGNQYYVHDSDMVRVGDEYYDDNYLSDNEIVRLEDGDYAHMDNCICINDEWYLNDDERVCFAEDIEEYAFKDDCWECGESKNWYTEDTLAVVDAEGNMYHPDHAPEQTTEE